MKYADIYSTLIESLHLEEHGGQYLLAKEPISDADIAVLLSKTTEMQTYGNRHVEFADTIVHYPPISHSVYAKLYQYLRVRPLFPSLKELIIDIYHARSDYIKELEFQFPLFLNSSLQYVELDGVQQRGLDVVAAILMSLPHNAPHVKTHKIRGGDEYKLRSGSLSSMIPQLTCLEHLELNEITEIVDFEILRTIGGLPNLTKFILRDNSNKYRGNVSGHGFMRLEELHIAGCIELVSSIICYVGSPNLKNCECFPSIYGAFDFPRTRFREPVTMNRQSC